MTPQSLLDGLALLGQQTIALGLATAPCQPCEYSLLPAATSLALAAARNEVSAIIEKRALLATGASTKTPIEHPERRDVYDWRPGMAACNRNRCHGSPVDTGNSHYDKDNNFWTKSGPGHHLNRNCTSGDNEWHQESRKLSRFGVVVDEGRVIGD